MLMKSKVGLALALVLGTASVAVAAPKHMVHRQVPAAAYQAYGQATGGAGGNYGFAVEHGQVKRIQGETGAVLIQDRDFAQSNGEAPENIW
jgi:hypothetical protein